GQIARCLFCREIGLLDAAAGNRRVILDASDHPQLMHAAVARPVRFVLKRTSRIGPNCSSKEGTMFFFPKRCGTSRNIGFSAGIGLGWPGLGTMNPPDPPRVGWA